MLEQTTLHLLAHICFNMFPLDYYKRITVWKKLRNTIETSVDPFKLLFDFWNNVPTNAISTDPYDEKTWPDPWEMIQQNDYCEFKKILAIFYTLQLTDRFSEANFKINITLDRDKSRYLYLLSVDNLTIGIYNNGSVGFYRQNKLVSEVQYSKLPQYN